MNIERQQARDIANQWLDMRMNPLTQMVPGDPDCDACVLARQYMRAIETIEQLQELLRHVHTAYGIHHADSVKRALADVWPKAVT